ncbi:MAG: 2-phospho-L-lactate guanylyltransferase [Anaerolineae bacterium]|jgi:2-phospho-L-lactate/phosphoenolpyruvate guanylyltransferase|nr:2-phospho-L-lactate guanylyltransferase [Anaerolineae bacterium]MBT7074232.1 2-phospho-L-lactate guanylyltransferase [Anaerolineae bacterium]MBT7783565.1 2-phospho-L-lactate guanylyltransferase [Anaerolineae bacterium]
MTIWAIVPVKPLRRGKSRLAETLTEDERAELNRQLLAHTLKTLKKTPKISEVLVVSRDPKALAIAHDHEARTIRENGSPSLNTALERATAVVKMHGAKSVLVLPADLPLISQIDIEKLLSAVNGGKRVVVITPDRHKNGTNALFLSPIGVIEYDYGVNSFERHCELARKAGARLEVCELPSIELDLDLPEDLELVAEEINFSFGDKQGLV